MYISTLGNLISGERHPLPSACSLVSPLFLSFFVSSLSLRIFPISSHFLSTYSFLSRLPFFLSPHFLSFPLLLSFYVSPIPSRIFSPLTFSPSPLSDSFLPLLSPSSIPRLPSSSPLTFYPSSSPSVLPSSLLLSPHLLSTPASPLLPRFLSPLLPLPSLPLLSPLPSSPLLFSSLPQSPLVRPPLWQIQARRGLL